jgi:putative effector of murein hydrolase
VQGYVYELFGLCYYVMFVLMNRRAMTGVYTQHSKALTLLAAIVLVGAAPFHYAANGVALIIMLALAVIALAAATYDRLRAGREKKS